MQLTLQGFTIATTPGIRPNGKPLFTAMVSTREQGTTEIIGTGDGDLAAISVAICELFKRGSIRAWNQDEIHPHLDHEVTLWKADGERLIGTLFPGDPFGNILEPYAIRTDTLIAGTANVHHGWYAAPANEIVDIRNRN